MVSAYALAGYHANAIAKAASVTVTNEHAQASLQKANLLTGQSWIPFVGGAAATDWEMMFDLNRVLNGSFESDSDGEVPTSWVVEGGTPTVSNNFADVGSVSLKLDQNDIAYQDFDLVPGKKYRLEAAIRGAGSSNSVDVQVIDLDRGKYHNGSSWGTSAANFLSRATASFNTEADNFTLEAQPDGGLGVSRVRVRVFNTDGGTGYIDDIRLYPHINFASLHGFAAHDSITFQIRSSNDHTTPFSSNDVNEDSLANVRRRSFVQFTPASTTPKQFWKFLLSGTLLEPFRCHQPVLGFADTFLRTARKDYRVLRQMPQSGPDIPGLRIPANEAEDAPITLELAFRHTETQLAQAVDDFVKGSGFGGEPIVVVANSDRPHEVVLGRALGSHEYRRTHGEIFEHSITIEEEAPPAVRTL